MAKDAYWFRHDANARNDIKVIELRSLYGYEGYGIYFAILEVMREQAHYAIPENKIGMVGVALGEPPQKVAGIIEDCIQAGLFVREDGLIYSPSFINRLSKWEDVKNRNETNGAKGGRPKANPSNNPNNNPNETQSKPRREEKRIEEEKREKTKSAGYPPDFDMAWELYKRKGSKKLALTEWNNLTADEKKKVHSHIPAYIGNTEPKYVKDFERYLKHGKYESETVQTQAKSFYLTYSEVLVTMHKEGLAMNRFVCLNGENGNTKTIGDKGEPMWMRK